MKISLAFSLKPSFLTNGKIAAFVGAKGLVGTKKFLDTAGAGKTVPAPFVQAYLPAIKMLDNIVKGGPGFIQMLRSLEKRAKSSRK